MEPIIQPKLMPFPNRRKTIRRDEDIWRTRHTEALNALLTEFLFEVRNTLTAVSGYTEVLKEEIDTIEVASAPDLNAFKQRWNDRLDRLSKAVQRTVDQSRQVYQLQPSKCQISPIVMGVLNNCREAAEEKKVSIQCRALENLPMVLAYEGRLRHVFFFVISRAIQVTQPGGSVTVSGRVDQTQGAVVIEVRDTGPGIALQLCDVFNSGRELSVTEISVANAWPLLFELQDVRKIIETHGGRISIESSEGVGTKCSISFPVT